jgi:tRNA G18 (ribose-2'-O)-methylase SpoU
MTLKLSEPNNIVFLNPGTPDYSGWLKNVRPDLRGLSEEDMRLKLDPGLRNFYVVMEHLTGDFNISTLIRNANAFGARGVFYLGKKQWDRRGAQGVHHYTPVKWLSQLNELKDIVTLHSGRVVAVENNLKSPKFKSLDNYVWSTDPVFMILGEEGRGLSEELLQVADDIVGIPQVGSVPSLNVGCASSIVMWDYVRQVYGSRKVA